MQSEGTKQINFLNKSESQSLWKWNKHGSNQRKKKNQNNRFLPANPFQQKKVEAETILGPGAAAGIGCGAGFGFGLVGGIGYSGWPWNQLRLVIGFGVGCGIGVGFGYGQGIGYGWSLESIESYLTEDGSDSSSRVLVQT